MPAGKQRHPTINDVAARAGVSKSLVSLVMRNSPNVSPQRRAAVLQAAQELGYRPNAVARSLVSQRTGVFGVVLSDLHNPFFADVADGIEERATEAGYRALLSSGFLDPQRESVAVDTLLQLRVDALMLLGSVAELERFAAAAAMAHVVAISGRPESDGMDSVRNDDPLGAGMLVDHLAGLGHRSIAHISAGAAVGGPGRLAGYQAAMARHGLTTRVVDGTFTQDGGRVGMQEIIESGDLPTAVMAPNDFAAIGALEAADAAGLAVPGDVSITGYDNMRFARTRRLDLTTVAQPAAELGRTAVEMLLERIEDGRTEARHEVLAPKLVVGSTTGPPRE